MTDRPILFSGPMIRALLEGRKTQTRRVILGVERDNCMSIGKRKPRTHVMDAPAFPRLLPIRARPGDRLWVREAHAFVPRTAYRQSKDVQQADDPSDPDQAAIYRAGWNRSGPGRWRPSIHMPRWASRLTLTVADVQVQRLQEISDEDAQAEGCRGDLSRIRQMDLFGASKDDREMMRLMTCGWQFRDLWDSLNDPRGYGWDANPWVAAYTFAVERRNIDQACEAEGVPA